MADKTAAPEQKQYFLSRSSDDADVALAVDRILKVAGQHTVVQDHGVTHQDFMAATERAIARGDGGAVTIAFMSEAYQDSKLCRIEYRAPLVDDPENTRRRLVVLRVADVEPSGFLKPIDYIDLVPVLAIEDDAARESVFREVVLAALEIGDTSPAKANLRRWTTAPQPSSAKAVAYLQSESGRTDLVPRELAMVAEALGYDPASLELASRVLSARPGSTPQTYLEALTEHVPAAPKVTPYPPAFRAAILTSFEVVEYDPAMQGHAATSLLALAAFAPGQHVPLNLLDHAPEVYPEEIRPFVRDKLLRRRALEILDRLALVVWRPAADAFTVAPVTQGVVRDLLMEVGQADIWKQAAAKLLGTAPPDAPLPAVRRDPKPPTAEPIRPVERAAPRVPIEAAPAAHINSASDNAPITAAGRNAAPATDAQGDTVRRLVQALKLPATDPLLPPEPPPADEPPLLVLDGDRVPPRVFAAEKVQPDELQSEAMMVRRKRRIMRVAVYGASDTAASGATSAVTDTAGRATDSLIPRPPRKAGIFARLFGRRGD